MSIKRYVMHHISSPEEKTRTTITLPDSLWRKIRWHAAHERRDVSGEIAVRLERAYSKVERALDIEESEDDPCQMT